MAATFNFPGTENASTVGIDEDGDDQFRVIGVLAQYTVIALQIRCVKLLENIFVQIALMILAEQVENIGWKQKSLVELNGAWFEGRLHGISSVLLPLTIYQLTD
jgi:hypothetical protein